MRWLQSRGAAIHSLEFQSHIPPGNHKALQSLQAASMLLLPQLPNLQNLHIDDSLGFMVPERHLHVMESLPRLKSLSLHVISDRTWGETTLEPLTHLSSLTSLSLSICKLQGPLWTSPLLTHLTQLQELRLHSWGPYRYKTSSDQLLETVSKLTTLKTLLLDGVVDCVPAQLGALAQLTQINLRHLKYRRAGFVMPPSFSLCTRLQCLKLFGCPGASDEAWQHACRLLRSLSCMTDLAIFALDLSGVQPSSWSLPSELTSLSLEACGISTVPAAICDLAKIQHLTMYDPGRDDLDDPAELTALPTGPYLNNLESLTINGPKLGAGPEALAHAVKLQSLGIDSREDANPLWIPTTLWELVPEDCQICFFKDYND